MLTYCRIVQFICKKSWIAVDCEPRKRQGKIAIVIGAGNLKLDELHPLREP